MWKPSASRHHPLLSVIFLKSEQKLTLVSKLHNTIQKFKVTRKEIDTFIQKELTVKRYRKDML